MGVEDKGGSIVAELRDRLGPPPPAVRVSSDPGANLTDASRAELQEWILKARAAGLSISGCVRRCGLTRATITNWEKHQPVFRERMRQAHAEFVEVAEEEVRRRGFEGFSPKDGVWSFSDKAAELVLRAEAPGKYGQRVEHNVSGLVQLAPAELAAARGGGDVLDSEAAEIVGELTGGDVDGPSPGAGAEPSDGKGLPDGVQGSR